MRKTGKICRDQWLPKSTAILTAFVLLCFGYLCGRVMTIAQLQTPFALVEDTRQQIPVVTINGIENGWLSGLQQGEVRVFLGDIFLVPNGSGAFAVAADDLFINYVRVQVPAGMRYVASKRGKKYYPVTSASGERLAPANRVYFSTVAEAEAAGYVP